MDNNSNFYNQFADPWKARNNVENRGYVATIHNEIFSPDTVKRYEK
jgi:hypothetical protein